MNIKGLDRIYIIHYSPLKERREYLEKRLKELGLEHYAEWIVSPENKKFRSNDLTRYDGSEKAINERYKVLHDRTKIIVGQLDKIMVVQHMQVLKRIMRKGKSGVSMVFEDDALLSDDFPRKLSITLEKLGGVNWNICYTDKGASFLDPFVRKSDEEVVVYRHPDRISNTTGSYLVNARSAAKIIKLMRKFSLPIDVEMTYLQKRYKLDVYWTVPFLTKQGSIECVYKSAVRKGSLVGICFVIIRKVEKISPVLARGLTRLFDKLGRLSYKSKFFRWAKVKFKAVIGY